MTIGAQARRKLVAAPRVAGHALGEADGAWGGEQDRGEKPPPRGDHFALMAW
jgi:hypothetical protein